MTMSITNLAIFVAILYGYEFYLKKRAQKPEVFLIVTEARWYRVFMLILAGSVFAMDVAFNHASFFVYVILFLSYAFTFKEIGTQGIVCNLKRTPLDKITEISVTDKKHSYYVNYYVKDRKYEMIVRKGLSTGLDEAIERVKKMI